MAVNNWRTLLPPSLYLLLLFSSALFAQSDISSGPLYLGPPESFPSDFAKPRPLSPPSSNPSNGKSAPNGGNKQTIPSNANKAPYVASLSLSNASGNAVHTSLQVNDPDGPLDITAVYILVQDTLRVGGARNSCFLNYNPKTDRFQLATDLADEWVSPGIKAGSPQFQDNTQCTLDVSGSAALADHPNSTVFPWDQRFSLGFEFELRFKAPFVGARKFYTFVQDASGADSGWVEQQPFQVSGGAAPSFGGVRNFHLLGVPYGSTDFSPTLEVGITTPTGTTNLSQAYFIIGPALQSAGSCLFDFDFAQNRYRMANDAGSDWGPWVRYATPGAPAAGQSVSNSFCDMGGPQVTRDLRSPQDLVVRFTARWLRTSNPRLVAYGNATDFQGRSSGWQSFGILNRPTPSDRQERPFIFNINDDNPNTPPWINGEGRIRLATTGRSLTVAPRLMYLMLGAGEERDMEDPSSTCLLEYDRLRGEFRLSNDTRTDWLPTVGTVGTDIVLENNKCQLYTKWSAASVVNTGSSTLLVTFAFTMKPTFLRRLRLSSVPRFYAMAVDEDGVASHWSRLTVSQRFTSVTLSQFTQVQDLGASVQGNDYRYSLQVTAPNGVFRAPSALLNLSTSNAQANSCQVEFRTEQGTAKAYLLNNAGTANQPEALGDPGITAVSNSQCTISNLQVTDLPTQRRRYTISVRFAPGYPVPSQRHFRILQGDSETNWQSKTNALRSGGAPFVSEMIGYESVLPPNATQQVDLVVGHGEGLQQLRTIRIVTENGVGEPSGPCTVEIDVATFRTLKNGADLPAPQACGLNLQPYLFTTYAQTPEETLAAGRLSDIRYLLSFGAIANGDPANPLRIRAEAIDKNGNTSGSKLVATFRNSAANAIALRAMPVTSVSLYGDLVFASRNAVREPSNVIYPRVRLQVPGQLNRLRNVYLLINDRLANSGGCLVHYAFPTRQLRLGRADGTGWLPGTLGLPLNTEPTPREPLFQTQLSNGNCFLYSGLSDASFQFGELDFIVPLWFAAGFSGPKWVWISADDETGQSTGWVQSFPFDVQATSGSAPYFISNFGPAENVATTRTAGLQANVIARIVDPDGSHFLRRMAFSVGSSPTDAAGCRGELNLINSQVALYNDAGTALGEWLPINSSQPIRNRFCRVMPGGNNVGVSTEAGVVYLQLELDGMANGAFAIFARATDEANLSSPWTVIGTHERRPIGPPQIIQPLRVQVKPIPVVIGAGQSLSFRWKDPAGLEKTRNAYFIVRNGPTTARACFVNYDHVAGIVRLANNLGNAWLPNTPPAGQIQGLANSQCEVHSVTYSNGLLQAFVRFTSALAGINTFEVYAENTDGQNTGWQIQDFLDIAVTQP